MADGRSSPYRPRVVALTPAEAFIPNGSRDVAEWVFVDGAYQAAAEMLSAPTAAIVLDLRVLRARHYRLLAVARQLGVEILAVGVVPARTDAEKLNGVRLTARKGLADELLRLAAADPEEPATADTSEPAGTTGDTAEQAHAVEPMAAKLTPAKRPAAPPTAAKTPGDVLTNDELNALLEGRP